MRAVALEAIAPMLRIALAISLATMMVDHLHGKCSEECYLEITTEASLTSPFLPLALCVAP